MEVSHYELPLFFVPQDDLRLARSAYNPIRHKGLFYPSARVNSGAVPWAVEQILKFIDQEQVWATDIAINYDNDPSMRKHFVDKNLVRRIKGFDPIPVP